MHRLVLGWLFVDGWRPAWETNWIVLEAVDRCGWAKGDFVDLLAGRFDRAGFHEVGVVYWWW